MILGYKDLIKAWKIGKIGFSPDIEKNQIGISSIDLRLGYEVSKLQFRPGVTINPALDDFNSKGLFTKDDYREKDGLGKTRLLRIEAGEFMVAFTLEEVHLPNNLAASVEGRSRLARWGLAVHTTAPHIDPAFVGPIALELYNHGPFPNGTTSGDRASVPLDFSRTKISRAGQCRQVYGNVRETKRSLPKATRRNLKTRQVTPFGCLSPLVTSTAGTLIST